MTNTTEHSKARAAARNWTADELRRLADADDLHVSPFREDGATYGTPTWIWSVVVSGALYVRAYNGTNSRWYRAALGRRAGRITVAGMTHDVAFEPVDGPLDGPLNGPLQERIDAAYRAKYRGSPYLAPMVGERTRAATVRILPLEAASR
jgi:hypothetical protein